MFYLKETWERRVAGEWWRNRGEILQMLFIIVKKEKKKKIEKYIF